MLLGLYAWYRRAHVDGQLSAAVSLRNNALNNLNNLPTTLVAQIIIIAKGPTRPAIAFSLRLSLVCIRRSIDA